MNSSDLLDYRRKTSARLEGLRTRITLLEKRASQAEADIQIRYDQKIGQIRGQYAQAKEKLEELGQARRETRAEEKTELERTIDALSESIDHVARRISV